VRRSLRLRRGGEDGFSLIELVMAIFVFSVITTALGYVMTGSMVDVAFARQRQVANHLATQAMEQVRALPFATLAAGLNRADLATADPDIAVTGSGATAVYTFTPTNETIPTGTSGTLQVPLNPHKQTKVLNGTTFTVAVYPTNYQGSTTSFRATVIVSWTGSFRKGMVAKVSTQTILFSPAGCVSSATHPFASPCQPFLYGTAAMSQGAVTVTGSLLGISLNQAALRAGELDSTMQIEQVSAVQGRTTTSGVSLDIAGQSVQNSGAQAGASASDTDPVSTASPYSQAPVSQGSPSTLSASNGYFSLVLTPSATETGNSISTSNATSSANLCPDPLGINQNDLLPCGSGSLQQAGLMSGTFSVGAGAIPMGNALLGSIGAAPTAAKSFTNRDAASGSSSCLQTTGDGCLRAESRRSIGTVSLVGLPANLASLRPSDIPSGWNSYLLRVSSFSDTVSAESGVGSAAPTATMPTGAGAPTISYWNGAGYSTTTIAPGPAVAVPVASVNINDAGFPGGALSIQITAGVSTGGTVKSDPDGGSCAVPCIRTSSSARSASPIVGDITYKITHNGVTLADLTVHVDLGTLLAQTSYKAAPGAG
jgi:prepilin-type N-terminal cleavage/methylation domain-containing protein